MTAQAAPSSSEVDAYLAERIRQPHPEGCHVVPGSTPVVSFGDVRTAWVATLALNPSSSEFLDKRGDLLAGDRQRFESLSSLGIESAVDADDDHVRKILDACYGYFAGPNPYWTWFRPLENLLQDTLGASFVDGSAAHLDLVQWATDPVWGRIGDSSVRQRLIESDREFLRRQLRTEGIRLVLVNGRTATHQLVTLGAELEELDIARLRGSRFRIWIGYLDNTLVIGWNKPFPAGAISHEQRDRLVAIIRREAAHLQPRARRQDKDVSIPKDTAVTSKSELRNLLEDWLGTGEKTLGDISRFAGRPWIRMQFDGTAVVLNADTKRTAVQDYLHHANAHGDNSPWTVVANSRGKVNKVVYRTDGDASPGWYAYTTKPQPPGTVI